MQCLVGRGSAEAPGYCTVISQRPAVGVSVTTTTTIIIIREQGPDAHFLRTIPTFGKNRL
jgi:beta-lactam-binding protein with PASTA domain